MNSTTDTAWPTTLGVTAELSNRVLTVTINGPESLNSLTEAMLDDFAGIFERATSDHGINAVRLGAVGWFQLRSRHRQQRRSGQDTDDDCRRSK